MGAFTPSCSSGYILINDLGSSPVSWSCCALAVRESSCRISKLGNTAGPQSELSSLGCGKNRAMEVDVGSQAVSSLLHTSLLCKYTMANYAKIGLDQEILIESYMENVNWIII